ncbi:MAG: Ldh family oxidoreductase [Nibricoccus sp.]
MDAHFGASRRRLLPELCCSGVFVGIGEPPRFLGGMEARYPSEALIDFANRLLCGVGLEEEKAKVVAAILVEADLLGHTTHGLQLLAPYLAELENGGMAKRGEPRVVADFPAAVTWDGRRLPGPWLTVKALALAMERARTMGLCSVAISRSHHIACLAAYLKKVADAGFLVLLTCSDPHDRAVAPHGGRKGVYSPNPIAAAWPTEKEPVIMDVSMSIVSNGQTRRAANEGRTFPAAWLLDSEGRPTDQPAALFTQPPGAILPIGGVDHGHKGFALGLMVEALTSGLAGHGRADTREGWSADVFLQVFDPRLFGGGENFRRQTEKLAQLCRENPERVPGEPVRMPGERALSVRARQLRDGVALHPAILPALAGWSDKLNVPLPAVG